MSTPVHDDESPSDQPAGRRWPIIAAVASVAVVLAAVVLGPMLVDLMGVDREDVDTSSARERLAVADEPSASPVPGRGEIAPEDAETFLLVGEDVSPDGPDPEANLVVLGIVSEAQDPVMVSIPTDVVLPDPCTGSPRRLAEAYAGCEDGATPLELVSLVVEDFTGVGVDHVAAVDVDAFRGLGQELDGVELCGDDLPEGAVPTDGDCAVVTTNEALGWASTPDDVGEGERRRAAVVAATTARQQELVLGMLGEVASIDDLGALRETVATVSDSATVSSDLSMVEAIGLVRSLRAEAGALERVQVPVEATSDGRLEPAEPFATTLERELGEDVARQQP